MNDQGNGATASAFDRLFHRLVVAGDRPIVRKKKKKTKKPPLVLSAATPTHDDARTISPLTTPQDMSSVSSHVAPLMPSIHTPDMACVRRLRLYRCSRRLTTLPRALAMQRLGETGLGRSQRAQKHRRRVIQTSLSPTESARRFIRLETIAVRLYPLIDNKSPSVSSEYRVLDDFVFPFATIPYHSRDNVTRSNAVPPPPSIS